MQPFQMSVSSPSVPLCSIFDRRSCREKRDSWNHGQSLSWLRIRHPFHCMPMPDNFRVRQDRSCRRTVALATEPIRWSLDDVERISRGLPSKAKTGSRAVPHRLNAEERKAFELAKKKGYVVQKARSRRYPLINSYRNYCDAVGLPSIRIEQGTTGLTDQIVIDFTPLHLSESDLLTLRAEITKELVNSTYSDQITFLGEVPDVNGEGAHTLDHDDSLALENQEDSILSKLSVGTVEDKSFPWSSDTLRFQVASRNLTKVFSQTALDTWRSFSIKS